MPRAFAQDGAFALPGQFFLDEVVAAPAIINLGVPGAPTHLLPFRALGGSVVDLDLLYGVLGHQADLDDVQPIFALGTRSGMIRTYGYEIPRAAIQAAVQECYATLLDIEDVVIESNPAGSNLFGSVASTTRPISSVTIANTDGVFHQLMLRELLLNAPAGLFIDIAHTTVAPVLTGTVTSIRFDGPNVVITYGFQSRNKAAPRIGN